MSEHIKLTGGVASLCGTQMKPELFEPATAEWAGRVAKNAEWLFPRQQQVLFSHAKSQEMHVDLNPWWTQLSNHRFWMNEVFGTFALRFYLSIVVANDVVIAGSLFMGRDETWTLAGGDEATYTSGGWKTLSILPGPDWNMDDSVGSWYGWLRLRGYSDDDDVNADFSFLSLTGLPRT